jgi:serine protease Do
MPKRTIGALVLGSIMAAAPLAGVQAQSAMTGPSMNAPLHGPTSVADLAEQLIDAVVNVSTSQKIAGSDSQVPIPNLPEGSPFQQFFDDFFNNQQGNNGGAPRERTVQSLGSGFVIDSKDGIVVTNNHVIDGADEIDVVFKDGVKLKAELIGRDPKTDIALLKIDPKTHPLKSVPLGNSDDIRIGDWVMAIGNPFGLGGSVSLGIVSARNRDINSGPYDDFIQTDAAINKGNSGGPLFDMNGEVIGINTAIISPSGGSIGIGFSIPSNMAKGVIAQLREYGETRRGWLGVRIQPVTDDIAESLGMKKARGALVAGVVKGGPVDDGSVQPGDVITKFDGKDIDEMRDLPRIVADSPVGKEVQVEIIRKGKEETIGVTLGRLEDGEKLASASEDDKSGKSATADATKVLGMTLGEMNDEARSKFGIAEDVEGVVVTEVADGSAAAEKGIEAGNTIVEVAQESVKTPKDVVDHIATLKKQNRKNALLMLAAKTGELSFVTVRID